eukprot:TRINITY_DN18180_c1_g2_i1.p1 TRINITY_DN18180_c1_g2~~TRINITY_DN18180_c1_g2_i1.p1  ORF type:complete len:285 (+),score=36.96 TRINITY_DN18180_c1_g2_i1:179-1033(+)
MQSYSRVSAAEKRYLLDGIKQGLRNDGRGCFDYRRITFELGPIPTSTGSCRLRAGDTELLVTVKCDMVKPARLRPDCGSLQVTVDCAPSVSVSLADNRNGEDWSRSLSTLVETLCASDSVVDRRELCVLSGVFAWEVHVDVLVLTSGGNLLDSISLALCAVLGETVLPKIEVLEAIEEGEEVQLKVDDRPEAGTPFPLKKLPLCVTVTQIQERFLLDVTPEEELCADAMVCVVVDGKSGDVVGVHKLGRGVFDVASLPAMMERCRATAAALVQQLDLSLSLKGQ